MTLAPLDKLVPFAHAVHSPLRYRESLLHKEASVCFSATANFVGSGVLGTISLCDGREHDHLFLFRQSRTVRPAQYTAF